MQKKNRKKKGILSVFARKKGELRSVPELVLIDVVAIALALVLFALPHHVIPRKEKGLGIVSTRTAAQTHTAPTNEPTDAETELPEQSDTISEENAIKPAEVQEPVIEDTADDSVALTGDFSKKFADKFITGDPVMTEDSYVSQNVNIQLTHYDENNVMFVVADIYIRDISCLRRGLAKGEYARNVSENIVNVVNREKSVVTISGDYYSMREGGVVCANGELYVNKDIYNDICVLYWDGTVKCFGKNEFDCEQAMQDGAYQIWNFGPMLLDENGEPLTTFPKRYDEIKGREPRAAFGYYEPGHYCFIAIDGRSSKSRGLNLQNMALLAQKLGLTQLYNLDGGKTAWMCFGTQTVNNPNAGGRSCSDYLCIVDLVDQGNGN